MPLTDINVTEKGHKPDRNYSIAYTIDENNYNLELTESEMKIITPFLESKGFSGHIKLHDWLKVSKTNFFNSHITDQDNHKVVINTIRELKRVYGLLSDELIADVAEKLPQTMLAMSLKAGNKVDVSIFQQELYYLAYNSDNNISKELKQKSSKIRCMV